MNDIYTAIHPERNGKRYRLLARTQYNGQFVYLPDPTPLQRLFRITPKPGAPFWDKLDHFELVEEEPFASLGWFVVIASGSPASLRTSPMFVGPYHDRPAAETDARRWIYRGRVGVMGPIPVYWQE